LRFRFKTTSGDISTTSALGVVMLCMTYDPDDPLITDQQTLLNYGSRRDHAECKISENCSLSITTKNNPMPVRYVDHNAGANAFNDYGVFYLATQGNPSTSVIGELWVDYEFEVFTPRISLIPSYQCFGDTTSVAGGTTVNFFDGIVGNPFVYGSNLCTMTQANATAVRLYFNQPGFYLLQGSMEAGTVTAFAPTAYSGNNTSQLLDSPLQAVFANNLSFQTTTPQIANTSGKTIAMYNLVIDATTEYVQNQTWISLNGSLSLSGTQNVYSFLSVQKIPNPVGNSVPVLPEITLMEKKCKDQDERINRLEQLLNKSVDGTDNNNSPTDYVSVKQDTPRYGNPKNNELWRIHKLKFEYNDGKQTDDKQLNSYDMNTASVLSRSVADSVKDASKSSSNKK